MLKRLLAGGALVSCSVVAASAAPSLPPAVGHPPIVLVAGGCGLAFHRNPFGACVPNRRVVYGAAPVVVVPPRLPPPCPRGYHRDPDPARPICYPNF